MPPNVFMNWGRFVPNILLRLSHAFFCCGHGLVNAHLAANVIKRTAGSQKKYLGAVVMTGLVALAKSRHAARFVVAWLLFFIWIGVSQSSAHAANGEPIRLNVVGGLASVNQYTRHEEPFWSKRIAEQTQGRVIADIQPFDKAGIRGEEMLRLLQLGVVSFGTTLLSMASTNDPILAGQDLAGLNPDMESLRASVQAFRPYLVNMLKERYGIEVLAVYAYPAQALFCNRAFTSLSDLKGVRIRTASLYAGLLIRSLGAEPVQLPFAGLRNAVQSGQVQCAITGTMSGNTIRLHEVTTHISPLAFSWGLSVFGANSMAWAALPEDVRDLLRKELADLERAIWDEADRETREGVLCNIGADACRSGIKGKMAEVPATEADKKLIRQAMEKTVLPGWIDSCGNDCVTVWNKTIGPRVGIKAQGR